MKNIMKNTSFVCVICLLFVGLVSCDKDSIESPAQLDAELNALMLDTSVEELLLNSEDQNLNTFNAELFDRVVCFSDKFRERQLLNEGFFSMFEGKKSIEFASLLPDYQLKKSTNQKVVLNGEEYAEYASLFFMMICAGCLLLTGMILGDAIIACHRFKSRVAAVGLGLVVNVIVCWRYVGDYGLKAAVWAAVLSAMVTTLACGIVLIWAVFGKTDASVKGLARP